MTLFERDVTVWRIVVSILHLVSHIFLWFSFIISAPMSLPEWNSWSNFRFAHSADVTTFYVIFVTSTRLQAQNQSFSDSFFYEYQKFILWSLGVVAKNVVLLHVRDIIQCFVFDFIFKKIRFLIGLTVENFSVAELLNTKLFNKIDCSDITLFEFERKCIHKIHITYNIKWITE